jgi:hypothetical protein
MPSQPITAVPPSVALGPSVCVAHRGNGSRYHLVHLRGNSVSRLALCYVTTAGYQHSVSLRAIPAGEICPQCLVKALDAGLVADATPADGACARAVPAAVQLELIP